VVHGQATRLSLEGDYWKPLLDCLAESEDGKTVSKGDLMIALKLLVPGELSEEAARSGDDLYDQLRVPAEKLRNTMSDLGRRLRDMVETNDKAETFKSTRNGPKGDYRAVFTTRYLFVDEQRHYYFGKPIGIAATRCWVE
jgi:hypothetical protein